jgi:fibro-slime domain-containing protein
MRQRLFRESAPLCVALTLLVLACSQTQALPGGQATDAGIVQAPDGSVLIPAVMAGAVAPGLGPVIALPSDFIQAEFGGYRLGVPVVRETLIEQRNDVRSDPAACSVMVGVVRDFRGAPEPDGHPDFEAFDGKQPTKGLLADRLGADRKPIYASVCELASDNAACPYGQMTTSRERFDQWYRSIEATNLAFLVYLAFEQNADVYTFASKSFFPLDGEGFGNTTGKRKHNFGFTSELHTTFRYRGGEHFSFTGDDDLWVFINERLAIDLGGLHPPATYKLDLDAAAAALGISPGQSYTLDLFHAERHSASSNFRVDTSIEFSDCGRVTPELF